MIREIETAAAWHAYLNAQEKTGRRVIEISYNRFLGMGSSADKTLRLAKMRSEVGFRAKANVTRTRAYKPSDF
jgi:hypothetical protein